MVPGSGSRESRKSVLNTNQNTAPTAAQPQAMPKNEQWDAQITQSEYEEIKERVTAIESKISKEFIKLQASLSNNSHDSVDTNDTRNGPERVLEKFERTVEETEMMNTSPMMTEQLAKHLSRGLKIRSSAENRVFRSPSARKIGNIRRRSQENVRLTRNKSWHLGSNNSSPPLRNGRITRNSPLQPVVSLNSPNVEKHIQIPRVNLKRGRPNTFANGLRSTQQSTETIISEEKYNLFTMTDKMTDELSYVEPSNDLKTEQWMCANAFFDGIQTPGTNDENALNTSKNSRKSSTTKIKPARKRLNMNLDVTPKNHQNQPRSMTNNALAVDITKTPMLPPRLPLVKKTPAKTSHSMLSNRNVVTPLWQQEQQQIAGRASIARLRSQNAGMVMAKAKLFDGLVTDQHPNAHLNKTVSQCNQETKLTLEPSIRNRLNQTRTATNSPRRNKASISGVNRRQQLRAQRHTPKKTPINLDKSLLTMYSRNGRNIPSPSIQSPMTRRMHAQAHTCDSTPHAKDSNLIAKPPRRIVTPQNKRKPI